MANQQPSSGNPRVDVEYRRKKSAEEMRYQIVSFTLMIFLTLVAFAAVGYEGILRLVYSSVHPFACCSPSNISAILFHAHEP